MSRLNDSIAIDTDYEERMQWEAKMAEEYELHEAKQDLLTGISDVNVPEFAWPEKDVFVQFYWPLLNENHTYKKENLFPAALKLSEANLVAIFNVTLKTA